MIYRIHVMTGMLLTLFCISLCCGCAETSLLRSPGKLMTSAFGKGKSQNPARILCLWEQAEGQGHDGKPRRGFAGQILMFEHGAASPVAVDGHVRIYQYDNFDPDEIDPKPIHVFEFDSVAWNAHRTMGTVGESYNVFLPYMNDHRDAAECGLQVEFIPESGRPLMSSMTEISLARQQTRSKVQPALQRNIVAKPKPQAPKAESPASPPRDDLNSLTIPLPKR